MLTLLKNGQHPSYLLLSDFESFPMPDTAVLDRMKSAEMGTDLPISTTRSRRVDQDIRRLPQ